MGRGSRGGAPPQDRRQDQAAWRPRPHRGPRRAGRPRPRLAHAADADLPGLGSLQALLRPILREHFQPALLARFQTLIYRPLQADALKGIVVLKLARVARRLQRHYGLACHIDEALNDALVAACLLPDSGARNIDSLLNQQILPVLSQQLLQRQAAGQTTHGVGLGYSDDYGVTLHFTNAHDATHLAAMEG